MGKSPDELCEEILAANERRQAEEYQQMLAENDGLPVEAAYLPPAGPSQTGGAA